MSKYKLYCTLLVISIVVISCKHSITIEKSNVIADSISQEFLQNRTTQLLQGYSLPEYFMPDEEQTEYKKIYLSVNSFLEYLNGKKSFLDQNEIDTIFEKATALNEIFNQAYDSFNIRIPLPFTTIRNLDAVSQIKSLLENEKDLKRQNILVAKLYEFYKIQSIESLEIIHEEFYGICHRESPGIAIGKESALVQIGDTFKAVVYPVRFESYKFLNPKIINLSSKDTESLAVKDYQIEINIKPKKIGIHKYKLQTGLITKDWDTIKLWRELEFYSK